MYETAGNFCFSKMTDDDPLADETAVTVMDETTTEDAGMTSGTDTEHENRKLKRKYGARYKG